MLSLLPVIYPYIMFLSFLPVIYPHIMFIFFTRNLSISFLSVIDSDMITDNSVVIRNFIRYLQLILPVKYAFILRTKAYPYFTYYLTRILHINYPFFTYYLPYTLVCILRIVLSVFDGDLFTGKITGKNYA